MANFIIEPIFSTEADRLTFLSRLWQTTVTAQDVLDWEAYKLLRPAEKLPTETHAEHSERLRLWREGIYARRAFLILAKWEGYKLGKIKAEALAFLSTRPNPNRTQSRTAVNFQLSNKYAAEIVGIDVANDLLPLVQGIVW